VSGQKGMSTLVYFEWACTEICYFSIFHGQADYKKSRYYGLGI